MREDIESLVARMLSPDTRVRQDALATIAASDANVLPELADLAASSDKPTAKAAKLGMERLVHTLLAPRNGKPDKTRREATAAALMQIAENSPNGLVKRYAAALLGFAGDESLARRIADTMATTVEASMMAERIRSNRY